MKKLIGETLISKGVLTEAQLKIALSKQTVTTKKIGHILVDMGVITQVALEKALLESQQDLLNIEFDPQLLSLFPKKFLHQYTVFPLRELEKTIFLATPDTERLDLKDTLNFITKNSVELVLWQKENIEKALDHHFISNKKDSQPTVSLVSETPTSTEETISPIDQLVNHILSEAIKNRASDIHLEPFRKNIRLRHRVDGILYEISSLGKDIWDSLLSRIKLLADMNISEKRLPQDGQFSFKSEIKEVDLRVSSIPSIYGEALALRVLDKHLSFLKLDNLGLSDKQSETCQDILKLSHGLVLVTGQTGSGKTTTLYSLLNTVNHMDKKIITLEDPVEYQIPNINQVNVQKNIGLTFEKSLRAILRQAPNIIMIGEIRDKKTAQIAIEASLTGHLVLSSLHTQDAPESIVRLFDMGALPYQVASSLRAVISQRLVRRICSECKEIYTPPKTTKPILLKGKPITLYKGVGCDKCLNTGYYGRTALFQIMILDEKIKEHIYSKTNSDMLRQILQYKGVKSLWEDGLYKANLGWTTLSEVQRMTTQEVMEK